MIWDLIARTQEFIALHLGAMERPAVTCSFGKDSMVMLALVREQKPDVKVVYFDALPSETKHNFAKKIIADWNLDIVSPVAFGRELIGNSNHVEIYEAHLLAAKQSIVLPIEAEPDYVPDENCLCAVEKLNAPTSAAHLGLDGIFIGHRNDDIDPTLGAVPLASDAVIEEGFRYLYPLKDWTEKDIWQASSLLNIPQNEARYFGNDMTANNDYYPLCTLCLSSDTPVICPKARAVIPGVRASLQLDAKREAWRAQFVNLAS